MPLEPEPNRQKAAKRLVALVVVAGGLLVALWCGYTRLMSPKHASTILVIDSFKPDFKMRPFHDAVIAFGPQGKPSLILTNLRVFQTVGGARCLSVSQDGSFFVVCESVGRHLTAYETPTGRPLWSVDGEFNAATIAQDGRVYAIRTERGYVVDGSGGEQIVVIDHGRILQRAGRAGSSDLALDAQHKALWLVGERIMKCDLELKVLRQIDTVRWCAASVDINPDGSIWAAEREHRDVSQSTNRIIKISSQGQILQSVGLPWSPLCLRADPSDGGVWVTGIKVSQPLTQRLLAWIERQTGSLPLTTNAREFLTKSRVTRSTEKYDPNGKLLHKIPRGGFTLEIDPSDCSLWLAGGTDRIYHYSPDGKELGRYAGVSAGDKFIAVVPSKPGPQPH